MALQVELPFGSAKHNTILKMIRDRRTASLRKMRDYHQKWDDADDSFTAYQPTSAIDGERKSKRKSLGIQDYTTITVPYTFAIIMTLHTYLSTVFLSRSPIYQLQGRHGEAQNSIEAFEAALDYQRMVGEHLVPLFNWLFDMSKYGLGIVGSYWDKKETMISRVIEQPVTLLGVNLLGKTKKVMQSVPVTKYEGNCLYNIRPYDFYPDPRVSITQFQKGEFAGRDTQVAWSEILEGKRQGRYFNAEQLAQRLNTSADSEWISQGSPRVNMPDQAGLLDTDAIPGPGFVKLHEMTIRLVPSVIGLSSLNRTECWTFTIANDSVVIGAQPQGLAHDEFPMDLMTFGMGAHEFMNMGLIEVMQPLVDTISWLLNSHFYNVRKALNDQKVVDPSRVVMKDLTSPIERGIIRLKPEAYGTPANQAIHQLVVPDMTANHLANIGVIEQMVQRISGVVDDLMGLSSGPSRESATGVRTRTGFAANRLKTIAEYNSALGFSPMMGKLISNTQQFMTLEQKFRIAGADGMAAAKSFAMVNPQMIAGSYDYVPVDGTLPIDRLAQATFWKELVMQIAANPMLASQWNLLEMSGYIMRLQGEKNIDRFKLNLASPQAIQQQVQAGNLTELGGEGGGAGAGDVAGGSSGGTI